MSKNSINSINYKDYSILKLRLEYSKTGVARLKTISGVTLAKAGGGGYDKKAAVFKELFKKLIPDLQEVCYHQYLGFDLFNYNIEQANDFLKQNNIDYKVNYKSAISNNLDFIELSKID